MPMDISAELAVMQSVGNALAQLPDAESRLRVLRWAADRVRIAEQQALAQRPQDPRGGDEAFPALAIHIRQDMDGEALDVTPAERRRLCAGDESLDTLIRTLAAELGQFNIDWRSA